jgi:hypothetical protein
MLDGVYGTIEDLATSKRIAKRAKVLRLTLLAPEIVEAILEGRQPAGLQLEGFRTMWEW